MKIIVGLILFSVVNATYADHKIDNANIAFAPSISASNIYQVKITKNIVYGKALQHSDWNSSDTEVMDLLLDIYQPQNAKGKRPVIFLFYGGGFEKGSKEDEAIVNSANFFASRGFIAVVPSYRVAYHYGTLPNNLYQALKQWPEFLKKDRDAFFAMYPACRDAKAAVRWLYAHADIYNADTNFITSLGNSAGALISIVLGTTDAHQFRDEVSFEYDSTLANNFLEQPTKIHTIINRWGGPLALDMQRIFFDAYPYDHHDAPMQIVHGTIDTRVPFFEALRLAFNYQLNDIDYELHPLHWVGHHAAMEKVNGMSHDELALQFMVKTQNLSVKTVDTNHDVLF